MAVTKGWWMVALLVACSSEPDAKPSETGDTSSWFNTGSGGSTTTGTTDSTTKSSTKSSTKSTTTGGGTGGGGALTLSISGLVEPSTGEGDIYVSGTDCVTTFSVNTPTEATGCSACAFAWVLNVGDLQPSDNDCMGAEAYAGIPLTVGHADPSNFWYDKNGWKYDKNGVSELQDDGRWYFSYGK